jgi:tight adherence protein B
MGEFDLDTVTLLIACGLGIVFIALYVVFGGFLDERRFKDRLEDIEVRARSGPRNVQMATLRRVERAGRLPSFDKLLWHWFPNAGSIRRKLQTSGMNVTLGDFAFASLALAVVLAFVLYVILDMAPVIAASARSASASACPTSCSG